MKLELFNFVDETVDLLESNLEILSYAALELENFFNDTFEEKDYFLGAKYRVKAKASLQEKILRNNLYLKHSTPGGVLKNLSDLIGIRMECRFIQDEMKMYYELKSLFNIDMGDGYFSNEIHPSVLLKMSSKQPKVQHNGFEIYKIDGRYLINDKVINFELQIKSMVNVFWSEIDHRILYKNFNYVLTENFYRDIMASIKDNLSMIDRQLMVVFDHLNDLDASEVHDEQLQIKKMLSKLIHDVYIGKVKEQLGFVISFKRSTDIIVNYIFMKEENGNGDGVKYSKNFVRVLNRITEISTKDVNFDSHIEFERDIFYNDEFTRRVGEGFQDIMNKDFRWNLFFKIIFEIEEGTNSEDFEGFLIYLRYMYKQNIKDSLDEKDLSKEDKDSIEDDIMCSIADSFTKDMNIDFINEQNIEDLNIFIGKLLKDINSYEEWISNKDYIHKKIMEREL